VNKRNFGRVIKRIEAHKDLWDQYNPPDCAVSEDGRKPECGSAYCFLGHAEYLRTGRKYITPRLNLVADHRPLAKWLGISMNDLRVVWAECNELADFKRWHKAGKVS
jgi:hypothetical protein